MYHCESVPLRRHSSVCRVQDGHNSLTWLKGQGRLRLRELYAFQRYKYIITLNRYDYFEPLSTTVPIPTWGYLVSTYFMVDRDRFKMSGIGGFLALKSTETYIKFN